MIEYDIDEDTGKVLCVDEYGIEVASIFDRLLCQVIDYESETVDAWIYDPVTGESREIELF